MASVSVCVIMLPHIPQLLTVRIDTAQENVQLMQPEFILCSRNGKLGKAAELLPGEEFK